MIPIRDNIRSYRTPFVMYAIVAANVAAFLYEIAVERQLGAYGFQDWLHRWALVPREIMRYGGVEEYIPFLTSMFLHGGVLHLGGNMLYLWVFGDNVEDRMGRLPFVVFYLLCGVAAGATQLVFDPMSNLPMVGASGAVAGVLGAYLVLFPQARVLTLVPVFVFVYFIELPAVAFLIIWLIFQNLVPAALVTRGADVGGIAHWAHIGGFFAGAAIALVLRAALRARRPIEPRERSRTGRRDYRDFFFR